ncbi:MAG: VCBS repeat-containing protein [Acidobacteria bacterium]|nr:VCBS repeat-containing protein [Acidobacteriota bacterium]
MLFIDVGDINADGRVDIVMSPAEPAGQKYRISWFEGPVDPRSVWIEHVVEDNVESAHHFVGVADFDKDGKVDIATATMHQGLAPTEIGVYLNHGAGKGWTKKVLATSGSHNMRIVDIDGDGDPDLSVRIGKAKSID